MLAVDIGNSRIKWRSAPAGSAGAAPWRQSGVTTVLDAHWARMAAPARVVAANVAGAPAGAELQAWVQAHWQLTPEFLRVERTCAGVRNGYTDHRELGVDRWLAVVGAWHLARRAACVVDCGTATTVNVLGGDGEFKGGLIAPGVGLMRRALAGSTAGLPATECSDGHWPARSTEAAIAAGCLNAAVGGIERAVAHLRDELGGDLACLLTGGEAPVLHPHLPERFELVPDLVLRGALIAAGAQP